MLKSLRAGAFALAAFLCAPVVALAACPTAPTYTGLTGKDAVPTTQTLQTVTSGGSSQQLATPLIHGNDGTSTPKAVAVDANCSLKTVLYDASGNAVVWADFTPTGDATLAVTTSSASVALPNTDSTIIVVNNGASDAAFKLSVGTGTAATTDHFLGAGRAMSVAVGSNTFINAITASGSTSLKIMQGTGSPVFSGGGGSGGAVTNAGTFAVQNTAATPVGANLIGKVGIDQTTPGATNAVQATNLPATVDTNAGAAGASTPRVVLATGGATPLPTGAATSANQPTAAAQASTTSGQTGTLVQGAVTTSAPSYTTAQTSPLSLDVNGNLRTNCVTGCAAGTTSNATSGVATSSTNSGVVAYQYCWNGATWDQCNPSGGTTVNGTVSLTANQGVVQTPNILSTYAFSTPAFALATSATDFLVISNVTNTKVSRLAKLDLVCTAASAAQINIALIKRGTSVDTVGTSTTITPTPVYSGFSAAQTVVKNYTANPTIGGTTLEMRRDVVLAGTTTTQPDRVEMVFGDQGTAAPEIAAATESIVLSALGATTSATCTISGVVTEQ